MKYKQVIGLLVALLALAFFSVALVVSIQHGHTGMKVLAWTFTALSFAFGIPVVTYKFPVSGLTAPTAPQVYGLGLVTAQLTMGDTDLTVDITHNFGLTAAELADLFPVVIMNPTALATVFPGFTFVKAANKITLNKPSAVNSGGTFDVVILRPHTNQGGTIGQDR